MDEANKFVFDEFDPISGELPDKLRFAFADQLVRARRLLAKRTSAELRVAYALLEDMLRQGLQLHWAQWQAARDKGEEVRFDFTPRSKLACYLEEHELPACEAFPEARLPEYFALLALVEIARAVKHHALRPDLAWFPRQEDTAYLYTQFFALEAAEAVSVAEALELQERRVARMTEQQARKMRRRRAQKAAIKSHATRAGVHGKFIRFYFSGDFPSQRQAAKRFVENELSEEEKSLYSPDNIVRTLLEVLRRHKKAHRQN
jgi:hypothetical protein